MIIGIGTDIVQIDRIKGALERRGRSFAERILCADELQIFDRKNSPVSYLAKRFAAKEAASKALGTGIGVVSWHDMEVTNDLNGRPLLTLTGSAAQRMVDLGVTQVHLSLSDEKDVALAFVVLSTHLD